MEKSALLLPGGGMRNAYISGLLSGLSIQPSQFDFVFACSSAAETAAFFIANQIALTGRIWIDELTSPNVFSYRRMLRGMRPADIDYVVEHCCRALNREALLASPTKLIVSIFNLHKGKTEFVVLTSDNFTRVMKATCAFPMLAPSVDFGNGNIYVDGGVEEIFAFDEAYRVGCRKFLVLMNWPLESVIESYHALASFVAFPWSPEARRALRNRAERIQRTLVFIRRPPPDVLLEFLAPPAHLPADRFCRDRQLVQQTYAVGFTQGEQEHKRIHEFLS